MKNNFIKQPISFCNGESVGWIEQYLRTPEGQNRVFNYAMRNPCYKYAVDKMIDTECSILKDNNKYCNEKMLLDKKAEIAKKRDDAIEERRINRELATNSIYEDANGDISLEIIFPNGKREHSYSLTNVRHIRLTKYKTFDLNEEILAIKWDGNEGKLIKSNIETKNRLKEFEKIGLFIRNVGRDRKKMLVDLIYEYLLEHASEEMVYPHKGWFYVDGRWKFITDKDNTLEKIIVKGS